MDSLVRDNPILFGGDDYTNRKFSREFPREAPRIFPFPFYLFFSSSQTWHRELLHYSQVFLDFREFSYPIFSVELSARVFENGEYFLLLICAKLDDSYLCLFLSIIPYFNS